jgi:hypothetical protein
MITQSSLVEDQWPVIRQFLPADLDESARQHGAMRRKRGQVKSAEVLLRLLLLHIAGGLSLEQAVARAELRGLAVLNAMALHKRLCASHRWLQALTAHLLESLPQGAPEAPGPYRVRVLDATDIQEPGSTGSDWRLHYSLCLPQLCCDFFELTDAHGGESLRRLPIVPGDLVLVDRGYNDRQAVAQLRAAGGEVILRYHSSAFPLLDAQGHPWQPLARLRTLKMGQVREWEIQFAPPGGHPQRARLCALRKSPAQAQRARARLRRKARGQQALAPATLEYADFVVVVTTLPKAEMSAPAVLEFYRARWQVELAFKRLKTLLQMGQVPKKKAASAQAWMQGKILTALLIERLLCEARFFSPWGYPLRGEPPVEPL